MAFHQPTRQAMQRAVRPAVDDREAPGPQNQAHLQDRRLDQSQTWVLFSPATDGTITASDFSETVASAQTPGRSQLSEAGNSIHAAAAAAAAENHLADPLSATASLIEEDLVEDDAELDSLDSHLPSFRSLPRQDHPEYLHHHHVAPVLPAHDGLGSFHLDHPTSGPEAQDQLYRFEEFNPRRIRQTRESIDRVPFELDQDHVREVEKRQRIEDWRTESSRILLGEIQRETQRRRNSQAASLRHVRTHIITPQHSQVYGDAASDNMTWHDEDPAIPVTAPDSFLTRITTNVIKDLLGIDDRLLSILLGEKNPEEDELSTTPRASQLAGQTPPASVEVTSWQDHMFERVSRELGILVNQISHHPGAFSAYSRIQQMPLPYAGLPVIPESGAVLASGAPVSAPSEQPPDPTFQPTINSPTRAINIPGRQTETEDVNMSDAFTKQEWEQDLDIKLVFRYIRSRFGTRNNPPQTNSAHLATSSTQDIAAKAARVRQHHPLISRSRPMERRAFKATTPSSPVALRHHSSCASQSTRRSARRSSVSSRHFWDIGGSLGTGSIIASNGPMGSWGEV